MTQRVVTPQDRAAFTSRRDYVRREMETSNGEYYQELKSELEWLNKILEEEK